MSKVQTNLIRHCCYLVCDDAHLPTNSLTMQQLMLHTLTIDVMGLDSICLCVCFPAKENREAVLFLFITEALSLRHTSILHNSFPRNREKHVQSHIWCLFSSV